MAGAPRLTLAPLVALVFWKPCPSGVTIMIAPSDGTPIAQGDLLCDRGKVPLHPKVYPRKCVPS